jgi:hypothetical protein
MYAPPGMPTLEILRICNVQIVNTLTSVHSYTSELAVWMLIGGIIGALLAAYYSNSKKVAN